MIRVYVTFLHIAYCSFLTNKFYVICKTYSKKKKGQRKCRCGRTEGQWTEGQRTKKGVGKRIKLTNFGFAFIPFSSKKKGVGKKNVSVVTR